MGRRDTAQGEIEIVDAQGRRGSSSRCWAIRSHQNADVLQGRQAPGQRRGTNNTALIWDVAAGKTTQTIKGHTDYVISASFSPDGKQLVTTSKDKTIRVWDLAAAKELALFKVERMVEEKDAKGKVTQKKDLGREFTHAVFTNDGKQIVAANLDGVVKIYDVDGKKEVKELKAHDGILALALSPDGTKIATGGWDQLIKIWSIADGR